MKEKNNDHKGENNDNAMKEKNNDNEGEKQCQ